MCVAVASNKAFITNGSGDESLLFLTLDNYSITKPFLLEIVWTNGNPSSGNVYVCNSGG